MDADKCVLGATNKSRIGAFERAMESNHAEHDRIWDAIDKLRNRLPVWATLVMTLMGTLLGICGTLAVISGKLSGVSVVFAWARSFFC